MSNSSEYLNTFVKNEICFLADPNRQAQSWGRAHGDKFAVKLLVAFESWSVIKNNRRMFKLSDIQFNKIELLFQMIEKFQEFHDYPVTPSQYITLLNDPDWKKIQMYAKELKTLISIR